MNLPGASSSPEKDNFVRLCTLLVDEGTALLREIFDAIHPPATLQAFLSKPETTTKLTKGQLYKQEEEKVYPSGGGTATSRDFDITLLCKLLKNVCNLTPPTSKWKTFPKPEHKGQADDLVRIRFYRNDVTAHAKEMKTDNSEFERLWREISSAMIRLANHISSDRGNSWTTRIAQCRSRALTFKEEQYVQEVLAWEKQDRDVKEIATNVEASVMILGQQVQTLTNIVTKEKGQGTIHIHIQGGSAVDKDGNPVPVESVGTIMRMIAKRYIEGCSLHDKEEHEEFRKYLQEVRKLLIDAEEPSSLRIRVRCTNMKILEGLWLDYTSGKLNEVAEKYLVTTKVLSECNLREMTLKTIIEEEEYSRCKTHLKEMQEPSSSSSIEESRTTDEVQVKGIKYCENILLGVGSQGRVYEGTFSGRKVAVKRMYKGPDEGNYVKDEAEKLKKLDHPNVIKCFEVEEDKEFVYLALEFCEKKLTDCVKQNDFHRKDSSLDGLRCLREITGAVAYLHERNICHRDINPDNILLSHSKQPRFVLADCNIAKNVHSASTVVGNPPGTLGYIAPELFGLEAQITTKADLFSLGCVSYYVISNGRHPFGSVRNLKKCQTNIRSAIRPPALEDGDFSQENIWTKSLIGRMLCYDPAQRPNARDVSKELEPVSKNTTDPVVTRTSTKTTEVSRGAQTKKESFEESGLYPSKEASSELVIIPNKLKGIVIGKQGRNLEEINEKTGADLFRVGRDVYMRGPEECRQRARLMVKRIVTNAPEIGVKMRTCCFIDDFNLPHNCGLRLIASETTPPGKTYYRLQPNKNFKAARQEAWNGPRYLEELKTRISGCLSEIKNHVESGAKESNDMWCHFGTIYIENVDKGEEDVLWALEDAANKLPADTSDPNSKTQWRTVFKGGMDFVVGPQLEIFLQKPLYETRHDFKFLTPSQREVRCKVWVKDKQDEGRKDEVPLDLVLEEFSFEDERTNDHCKGWLCPPTKARLRADIIFPACDFDCRLVIRKREEETREKSSSDKKEDAVLMEYLSHLRLRGEKDDELPLPDKALPSGYSNIYRRCCRRREFTPDKDFTIIVSEECTFPSPESGDTLQKKTDLHLHCNTWDKLLRSGKWEPKEIEDKLSEFLEFVKKAQKLIMQDRNASSSAKQHGH